MHKYHVRMHVVPGADMFSLQCMMANNLHTTTTFPETKFLGVTAYQNERITQLKIDYNPFAKGFRENGHLMRTKRKSEDLGGGGSVGAESQRSRTDSTGSLGGLSGVDTEEESDEVFHDEEVSPDQVTSTTDTKLSPIMESPVRQGPESEMSPSPKRVIKAEESPVKTSPTNEKVSPIISRPFQFPPPASLSATPPSHHQLLYYHHLLSSSPLLPYLHPFYPPASPSDPALSLLSRLPPASPGSLPPSPSYIAAEYLARNFSLNRNQM